MSQSPTPTRKHLAAYEVLPAMEREAEYFLTRSTGQTLLLALAGGMFVTQALFFPVFCQMASALDELGDSFVSTNPEVSADLIQLIRYRRAPGEAGRSLVPTGAATWAFPKRSAE